MSFPFANSDLRAFYANNREGQMFLADGIFFGFYSNMKIKPPCALQLTPGSRRYQHELPLILQRGIFPAVLVTMNSSICRRFRPERICVAA